MWNYQIKTTPETQKIVRNYLHSLGFHVNQNTGAYGFYPYVVLNFKNKYYSSDKTGNEKLFGRIIDFNFLFSPEFAAEFKNAQKPEFIEVVLNKQYTAKVYKDKVVVGCQTFDWSLIKEMVEVQKKLD